MRSGCGKMALCPPKMCLSILEMKEKIWIALIFMMGKFTLPSVRTSIIWRVRGRQAWWMWTHYSNAKRWVGCHREVLDYTEKDLDEESLAIKLLIFPFIPLGVIFTLSFLPIPPHPFFIYTLTLTDDFVPSLYIQNSVCELIICSQLSCFHGFSFFLSSILNYLNMVWFTTSLDIKIHSLNWNKKG